MIEDKRKFDIMEFVSFRSSQDGKELADSGREREREGYPSSVLPLTALSIRYCVWLKPRLPISSRAMKN